MIEVAKNSVPRKILFGLAIGSFALIGPSAVQAQVDEIIVTAQKREQNIQDVPVAVTAFDANRLENIGFRTVYDLQDSVPGLFFTQAQSARLAAIRLRGIGTSGNNAGLEPSVGVFIDGVYRASAGSSVFNLPDVERIEVLRGPQGTLFGRNTSSGSISIISKAPEFEFGGSAEVTFGNFDLFETKGTVTGPIVQDVLAARLTGFYENKDGYITNVTTGNDINDRDRWGLKGQFLFTPTNNFDAKLIIDYTEVDEKCCAAVAFASGPSDGALAALGATVISPDRFGERLATLSTEPFSVSEDKGISLEMNWDIGGHTITSITAYRDYEFENITDSEFSELALVDNFRQWDQEVFTQELRIANNEGERFEYVLGAYYFNQDLEFRDELIFGADANIYVDVAGILGTAVESQFESVLDSAFMVPPGTFSGLLAGDLSVPPGFFAITNPFPGGSGSVDDTLQEQSAYAFFAQGTWNATDKLSFTGGIRYTKEKKELSSVFTETPDGGAIIDLTIPAGAFGLQPLPVGPGGTIVNVPFPFADTLIPGVNTFALFPPTNPLPDLNSEFNDGEVTGTGKIQYYWTPDIQTYFSYSRGYKSGGTNVSRIDPSATPPDFDAETVSSYEIGFKSDLFDNSLRLNGAAYYAKYNNFQINTFLGTGFVLQNAGIVDAMGIELEATYVPNDWLTIDGQTTFQDVTFDVFPLGPCILSAEFAETGAATTTPSGITGIGCNRGDDDVPNTPDFTLNLGMTADGPVFGSIYGFLRGEWTYRTEQVTDTNNDPRKDQSGYSTINLRAGLRDEDGLWEIVVWTRNLLDEDWTYLAFDGTLQDGKLYAYPNEPRTFGITLKTKF